MDSKQLSLELTPSDIKTKEFSRGIGGYNPREVVEYLDKVAKTWERVQKHEREMLDRIQALSDEILKWKGREAELGRIREKALAEADEARDKAKTDSQKLYLEVEEKVEGMRRRTEEWLESVIAQVEEIERQKNSFMTAFKSALDSHYDLLRQRELEASEPLGARLNHFLKNTLGAGDNKLAT